MMRIVVAHNYYQQPGGEDQCVAAEIKLLEAHGHAVIPYHLHNADVAAMNTMRVGLRAIWSGPAFQQLRAMFRVLRPDVVHFHNTFPLISPAGYYAARAEGVPVVQTLHNFRLICSNAVLSRAGTVCEACVGRRFGWPGVVRGCYHGSRAASAAVATVAAVHRAMGTWTRMVDCYVALTDFGRQKFIVGGLPAELIAVKPNFVLRDPGRGRHRGGYAAFVGRLSWEKGVQTLLQAWPELGGRVRLKVAGDGPMAAMVRGAATQDPSIEWLGNVPPDAIAPLLGDAVATIVPSNCYEGFPRVIAESFAAGTPVVASDFGAMAALIRHGETGLLFRPGDGADLAAKVSAIMGSQVDAARLGDAARTEFEQSYTAEVNHRALMAIYQLATARRAEQ